MAETWKKFEEECVNYLKSKYPRATFQALGQSDSTRPDIYVIPSHGTPFYMETKSSNAQCGQFVLIPNEEQGRFDYSQRNSTPFFYSTRKIMDYMDNHFSTFVDAKTAGKGINLDTEIFYDWIKSYYSAKCVEFFITKEEDYLIFPTERFSEYFDVSCSYRMKKSGSSRPSMSKIPEIKSLLQDNGIKGELKPLGKELYLVTSSDMDGVKLHGAKYTYMFRAGANSSFRIRQLSNTSNSNVIFQISLKKYTQDKNDLFCFTDCL